MALLFLFRFFFAGNLSEDQLFLLLILYTIPTWVAVMVINFYEGHQLMEYMRINHYNKWEQITAVPFFGSGGVNNVRTLSFIFSEDDLGDDKIRGFKKVSKKLLALTLTVFFTFPVIWMLIAFMPI